MFFQQAAIEWEWLHCQQLVTSDYLKSVTVIITIAIILCRIRVGFLERASAGNDPGALDCPGPQQFKIRTTTAPGPLAHTVLTDYDPWPWGPLPHTLLFKCLIYYSKQASKLDK